MMNGAQVLGRECMGNYSHPARALSGMATHFDATRDLCMNATNTQSHALAMGYDESSIRWHRISTPANSPKTIGKMFGRKYETYNVFVYQGGNRPHVRTRQNLHTSR
ncbi:MAG: hypothetical protein HYY23_19120 [Verrucomicrobia bacterium]|nr:hypothetical protein [Verrucomicrobiota bacterium]